MAIAKSRRLTPAEQNELFSLKKEDITLQTMRDLFACKIGQENPRFNTYDKFTLPANKLYNKTVIETTIGRYLVNMLVLPEKFLKKHGYQNITLSKGEISKIEAKLSTMLMNDEITTKEYSEFIDRGEWLGMGCTFFLSPTMDYDINVPIPEVIELRDELFEKYKDGVKKGDSAVADKIEAEVLALAKKKIKEKGNEAYDFFESGVGAFGNNYKKTSIMAGAVENPYTHKLSILKSNYVDGIDKEEFPKFTNLTVIGGYSRGVETQSSGSQTKRINTASQVTVLGDKGTDCHTDQFLEIEIPSGMESMFLYRYILDPSASDAEEDGLVLLNDDNIKRYTGKKIKLRSPMCCKGKEICNKCAGEMFYKMGVKNAGLYTFSMSGKLMNISMKKFHDASIKFVRPDIRDYCKKL